MLKFQCTHCDQHIDAPDVMSGRDSQCPSCGHSIRVPSKLSLKPKVQASYTKVSKRRNLSAANIAIICIVILAVVFISFKIHLRGKERKLREYENEITKALDPDSFSYFDIAGLSLKLPSEPTLTSQENSDISVKQRHLYTTKFDRVGVAITHLTFTVDFLADVDMFADNSIKNIKSDYTNVSVAKSSFVVSGLECSKYNATYVQEIITNSESRLYMARPGEMWIIDVVSNRFFCSDEKLKTLADAIFSSIEMVAK